MNIILFSELEITQPLSCKDERSKHILSILKKKEGESFFAGIINGKSGNAQIIRIDSDFLHFVFTPVFSAITPPKIALIIGFPRPIQLKRLVRSVSSLGIAELHLTATELGEKSYLKSNFSIRENVEAALVDGAVQAKVTSVPQLFYHQTIKDSLSYFSQEKIDERLLLDLDGEAIKLSSAVENRSFKGKKIVVAIGSERGWTANERLLFKNADFKTYGLGQRILRTETAAVSALTLILAAMGHL